MKVCPRCKGSKKTGGYGCPGFTYAEMKCQQCDGAGKVPDEMEDWMLEGQRLRDYRIARYMTLRKEADRLGISVVKLSQAERGVIDPAAVRAGQ